MKKFAYIVLFSAASFQASAQLDFGPILEAGSTDASSYLSNYMAPLFDGLGNAMNGGWYNTAKPHKLAGFDITFGANIAYVPDQELTWLFDNSSFTNMQLTNSSSAEVPSLFGANLDSDVLPELTFSDDDGNEILRMNALTGLGLDEVEEYPFVSSNVVPAPFVQIGFGLIKNTDIKIRLFPEREFGDASVKMFGLGIMHDFKQWIPGLSALPLDMSAFFAFSKMTVGYVLDDTENQSLNLGIGGTTFQVVASKKLAIFTPFVGLGFTSSNTDFNMLGNYPVGDIGSLTDPISVEVGGASPRMSLGGRLKLAVLTLHAEYVVQKYNLLTLGAGISIR
ncbi:MAG: hypothetical protein JXQ90_07660 [Cyclobacteriaceae bacterium]